MRSRLLPLVLILTVAPLGLEAQSFLDKLKAAAKGKVEETRKTAEVPSSSAYPPPRQVNEGPSTSKARNAKDELDDYWAQQRGPRIGVAAKSSFAGGNAQPVGAFAGNDRVYLRFNLPQALKTYVGDKATSIEVVSQYEHPNGNGIYSSNFKQPLTAADLERTTVDVELLPDPKTATTRDSGCMSAFMVDDDEARAVRTHFCILQAAGKPLGHVTFSYDGRNTDLEALKKDQAALLSKRYDEEAASAGLPAHFKEKGSFSDPQLSMAGLQRLVKRDLKDVIQVLKLTIGERGGPDWDVYKDSGIPQYKHSTRPIYLAWKDRNGFFYEGRLEVRKNHQGGGSYGDAFIKIEAAHRFNGKVD